MCTGAAPRAAGGVEVWVDDPLLLVATARARTRDVRDRPVVWKRCAITGTSIITDSDFGSLGG